MRVTKKWDNCEIDYLVNNYTTSKMSEILSVLSGRTLSSITNKAHNLKLSNRSNSLCDLTVLLDDTPLNYYWIGFLLADGHFSKSNQIQVNLCDKDLPHLKKLANYLSYEKVLNKPNLYVQDTMVVKSLKTKFGISNNKTYHPPKSLPRVSDELLISLLIGFIDGDGSINHKGYLYIKIHKTWLKILKDMLDFLSNGDFNISINNDGLVLGMITKIEIMKSIKRKGQNLSLPMLERKWDRVDLTKMSKTEKRHQYDKECHKLFNDGIKIKDVITQLGYSRSFVYGSYQRFLT